MSKDNDLIPFTEEEIERMKEAGERVTRVNPSQDYKNYEFYNPDIEKDYINDPGLEGLYDEDGRLNLHYYEDLNNILKEYYLMDEEANIGFNQIPSPVKLDAIKMSLTGAVIFLLSLISYILRFTNYKFTMVAGGISLLLLYASVKKILISMVYRLVKFEGTVLDAHTYGLFKSGKYMVVKVTDDILTLNMKLSVDDSIKPGLPITIYLHPDDKIIESEHGPFIERIISYKLDISTDEVDEMLKEGVSAKDYVDKGEEYRGYIEKASVGESIAAAKKETPDIAPSKDDDNQQLKAIEAGKEEEKK